MSSETLPASGGLELQFGPFRLFPQQRLLLRTDTPLRLGSRAREILFALVERAGEIVMKSELIARVWPNTIVEEGTLRVHINALRKALGCGKSGARYVENVTGRGYLFIAPVIRREETRMRQPGLTFPLTRMIGREAIVAALKERLAEAHTSHRRFLSIVGPGGCGKSTVAASLADSLRASYPDGVRLIDLAASADTAPLAAVAASLGSGGSARDQVTPLINLLRKKQMLLVLDNCERVVDGAAALAETLLACAPGLHILATSREPLRTRSERLLQLPTLGLPPCETPMTATRALEFPAVQLFVERAVASQDDFELTDATVPVVVNICRKLDGLPLAIELAASLVGLFGVGEVGARIDDPLGLLTKGCRTAPQRHQTLRATLDWSYMTLSESERVAFQRLAIFDRGFDLNSAVMEIASDTISPADVADIIANLTAKCLLVRDEAGGRGLYRLLTTTRAYALEKLEDHRLLPMCPTGLTG
jgi:predicted ATPase/DNA-binding winged helix-turn-helix (wHTH) protein